MVKKKSKSKRAAAAAEPKPALTPEEINPSQFYRLKDVAARKFFGCGATALHCLIQDGAIPRPAKIGKRMRGYFGRDLLAIQQSLVT